MVVIPSIVSELLKDTAIWVGLKLGEAALGKYAENAVEKVNEQLAKIWARLRGQNPNADETLQAFERQDVDALIALQQCLQDAMQQDPELKQLVEALQHELESAESQATAANTTMMQSNATGAIGAQGQGAQAAKQIINIEKVENLSLPSPPEH